MTRPGYENDEFWAAATQIPDELKIALANFIINFGRIEAAIDQLIWWAAHIDDPYTGRLIISRLDIRPKCEMALKLLAGLSDLATYNAFKILNKKIETLTKRRNAIVHGWWIAFGQTAVAMSTKPGSELGALMEGEPFTLDDLVQEAESAKSTEQSILGLIGDTAPSRSGRGC